MKKDEAKRRPPQEFITTELGSAVFASVEGRPKDEAYLVVNNEEQDGQNGKNTSEQ